MLEHYRFPAPRGSVTKRKEEYFAQEESETSSRDSQADFRVDTINTAERRRTNITRGGEPSARNWRKTKQEGKGAVSLAHTEAAPVSEELEWRCRWACRIANVKYGGIQRMYGARPDQLLFQPLYGILKDSTLAVDIARANPLGISYRLSEAVAEARKVPARENRQ